MQKFDQLKSTLKRLELKRVSKQIEDVMYGISRDDLTPDERLEAYILQQIGETLEKIAKDVEYLDKPITAQGRLSKNEAGRYAINGDYPYFTSGSPIEILIEDEDGGYWVKTRIEHKNGDYYAVDLPNLKLDGVMARDRG